MRKFKILVVDDDVNLTFLLQQRLEKEGFQVATAHDVPDGVRAYRSFIPDLVLTDVSMGKESGFDLMRRIRHHFADVEAIYMTGDISVHQLALQEERRTHYVSVLAKPFSGRDLLEAVVARAQSKQRFTTSRAPGGRRRPTAQL
ncbi:MAG TPA: response regulator [Terriglobales bacterium]|jgi:DNA-binding NtrC family response regulator|nr:response regulator [Terriglobales bacterium]